MNGNGKTVHKTGQFAKGDDPRRGHGLPGRSGRPADEFREKMRAIIESPKVRKAFLAIMENPDHPQFAALWKTAAAYAVGQPSQVVEHTGGIELNVRELSDTFASRMDRLTQRLRAPSVVGELN